MIFFSEVIEGNLVTRQREVAIKFKKGLFPLITFLGSLNRVEGFLRC